MRVLGAIAVLLATAGWACATAVASSKPISDGKPGPKGPLPAVVLVHGAFVDGSGWERVYRILKQDGYQVTIVQNPTVSLADDVAVTRRAIDAQNGSVILVGHSYGGAVISEAGNDPKVAALVYIAAYAPDKGESLQTLIAGVPSGSVPPPILPPQDGFLSLDRDRFAASFAADVNEDEAAFMAASQVPCGVQAVGSAVTTPAWREKPSFYLVTKSDKMIPPSQQRQMAKRAGSTVVEVEASHAVMISKPDVVASVIEKAAASTSAK
jgi:pimeloyl-ACP methyl ester carboxylesterase